MSDAYSHILNQLEQLGCFADVRLAHAVETAVIRGPDHPLAILVPGAWEEVDDVVPGFRVRSVDFQVVLSVRTDDGEFGFRTLDGLGTRVQEVLDGSTLGGTCQGVRTRVVRGSLARSTYPEHRSVLVGRFTFVRPVRVSGP